MPGSGGIRLSSQDLGNRGRRISEFESSLVYRVSSRTSRDIQRNPLSKNKTKQQKISKRAGEVAQRLRALASLPEVLSSIPRNHMVSNNCRAVECERKPGKVELRLEAPGP